MVLTDRQRSDLHAGIYEYLMSQEGKHFEEAAEALAEADHTCVRDTGRNKGGGISSGGSVSDDVSVSSRFSRLTTASGVSRSANLPILERKWTAVPRLQRKVLELEKAIANNTKIYGHRGGSSRSISSGVGSGGGGISVNGGIVNLPHGTNIERRNLPRQPYNHSLQGHAGVVTTVAIHPTFTICASGSEDATIKIWDHENGDYVKTLKGHVNTIRSITFTPTGSHLASASSDLTIKLWDMTTYNCVRTLRGHDHTISAVRFIPMPREELEGIQGGSGEEGFGSGKTRSDWESTTTGIDSTKVGTAYLLSASRDRTIKFWNVETGFCQHTISDHKDWVRCLAVKSDGSILASAGNEHSISVYHATGKRNKLATLYGHEHVIECLAFVTQPTPVEDRDKKGGLSHVNSHSEQKTGKDDKSSSSDNDIQNYLASGGRDRTVRLWNITTSECIAVFSYHENWVRSVLIHPTGKYIISAGDDRTIRVMDVANKRCLRTLEDAHPHFVTCLAMHHTLPIMVSGGVDQTVNCWQLD